MQIIIKLKTPIRLKPALVFISECRGVDMSVRLSMDDMVIGQSVYNNAFFVAYLRAT